MAALSEGVFLSKPFVFIVGENRAVFLMHATVVGQQSKALDVLVSGTMAEAQNSTATFEDVSEDTFERFCQFAYTGDYKSPKRHLDGGTVSDSSADTSNSSFAISVTPCVRSDPAAVAVLSSDIKPKIPAPKSITDHVFEDKVYKIEKPVRCRLYRHNAPDEDYRPVFLGHARLYGFAEKWGIAALQNLTLYKIFKILVTFTKHLEKRDEITALIDYVYSDEGPPDRVGGVDKLRELVVLYDAWDIDELTTSCEFRSLIERNGSFARDLVLSMKRRFTEFGFPGHFNEGYRLGGR